MSLAGRTIEPSSITGSTTGPSPIYSPSPSVPLSVDDSSVVASLEAPSVILLAPAAAPPSITAEDEDEAEPSPSTEADEDEEAPPSMGYVALAPGSTTPPSPSVPSVWFTGRVSLETTPSCQTISITSSSP